MSAGALRQPVWVQVPVEDRRPDGQVVTGFTDLYLRYGRLESLSGAELVRAQQVQATVSHLVTLRSDRATRELSPKERLRLGARYFGVLWVPPDNLNRWVKVYCAEEVQAGAT